MKNKIHKNIKQLHHQYHSSAVLASFDQKATAIHQHSNA